MKKKSGCPWTEKLKIQHITDTSDYIEVKISAESRRVSAFIKTIRPSILTSDKFIFRFLKGTKCLCLRTPTNLCVTSRRQMPQGHGRLHAFFSSYTLPLKPWLAVLAKIKLANETNWRSDPGWQFSSPQLPQHHVKVKDVHVYYWRTGRQESKSLWGRGPPIVDTKSSVFCHEFTNLHFKSNYGLAFYL